MRGEATSRRFPRPTRFGLGFLLLVLLTLVGCINYGLSLGYGLTFLLAGVWVISAAQVGRGARGLHLTLIPPGGAQVGHDAAFSVSVQNSGPSVLVQVRLITNQGESSAVAARVKAGERRVVGIPVTARQRGLLTVQEVRVAALDRMGLWYTPLPSPAPTSVPVFPAPELSAPPAPERFVPGAADSTRRTRGDEDFAGLRPYTPGDSPRQVSWRHVARTGALLTRETDAPQGSARLLDWADTAGDPESRISRLSAWVAEVQRLDSPFALRLPGQDIPVGQGEGHIRTVLTALALHEPPGEVKAEKPKADIDAGAMRATLLALAVALAPGAWHQPWWVSLIIAGLLLHTFLRTQRPWKAIPTWLLGLFAGLALALLNGTYGTLLGRDAGTALLALLVTLKTAETHNVRDGKLLVLLGLFLTSTHYFFSQGPLTALYTLLSAVMLLMAASRWTAPSEIEPHESLLRTGKLMALAAPLALLLFVLYPRPDHPLWQLPLQGGAQTGLSNEINAGEFSNLAQSSAVAFRADFQGAVPPPDQRYWRGPVYEAYDGQTWRQVRMSGPSPSVELYGPTWTYTLTLEAGSGPWLLALDAPETVPDTALRTTAFQAISPQGAGTRRRVQLQSRPAVLGRRESQERLRYDLQLPAGQSPQAVALAAGWRKLPPAERVKAALNYLTTHGFTYTLNPPLLPEQNRVDAFLFSSRQGFCEHYASAFVFLMRAAGLPARIVGGYLGGQYNPDGDYLIIRQQDAHAWTEVWLPGSGWVRVDPTAVIAPARVNAGLATALSAPQATAAPNPNLWGRVKLRLDALQNRWNDLVIGYDGQQQQALLSRAGLGRIGSGTHLLTLALLTLLALLPAVLLIRTQGRPQDPAERALHDLTLKLRLPRAPGETLTDYVGRIQHARPHLAPALNDVLNAYHAARYAPDGQQQALRTLRQAVKRVKRVKQ